MLGEGAFDFSDDRLRHDSEKPSWERLMSTRFIERLSQLRDPRVESNKRYPSMEVLLLAVCAMLSGAEGWERTEEVGQGDNGWAKPACVVYQ